MNKFRRFINNMPSLYKRFISGRKRKYPINPADEKLLPTFQYVVSKKSYRRIFTWGNIQTGALGFPYIEKNEKPDQVLCIRNPKRISFGERFEVTTACCGFGFTAFAVNSDTDIKVYGSGLNTDCQIGYHSVRQDKPLGILFYPQPIHLPFKNPEKVKVLKLAAGRAHLAVLTDEGLFLLGNNAYGQCGRTVIEKEDYSKANFINLIDKINGERIIDIECGQDHSLALTESGCVYSCGWGADGQTGVGHFNNITEFTKVIGDTESEKIVNVSCRSDFVLALNDKGEVFGWGNTEYSQLTLPNEQQQCCHSQFVEMLKPMGKIVSIGTGGSFCAVVNDEGEVFTWGYGLLGVGPAIQQSKKPLKIPDNLFGKHEFQPDCKVIKVRCGLSHFAAVTKFGDLFTWGRNRAACLGLGHMKDQYFPLKVSLGGVVEEVFCGIDHSVAICKPFV